MTILQLSSPLVDCCFYCSFSYKKMIAAWLLLPLTALVLALSPKPTAANGCLLFSFTKTFSFFATAVTAHSTGAVTMPNPGCFYIISAAGCLLPSFTEIFCPLFFNCWHSSLHYCQCQIVKWIVASHKLIGSSQIRLTYSLSIQSWVVSTCPLSGIAINP